MKKAMIGALLIACIPAVASLGALPASADTPQELMRKINLLLIESCANQPKLELLADGEIARKDANGATWSFKLRDLQEEIPVEYDAEAHVILACRDGKRCIRVAGSQAGESAVVVFSLLPSNRGEEFVKLVKELAASLGTGQKK